MLKDKWENQTPSFSVPTQEQIKELEKQAEWDKRIRRILPKLKEMANNGRVDQQYGRT